MCPFPRLSDIIMLFALFQMADFQHPHGEETYRQCLAVKFEMSSMTPKRLQVFYCYMNFAQSGSESAKQVVKCIEESGIQLSDPDITEIIRVLPEEECIEDIIEKKDALDSGEDYALQTDLADEKLAGLNISDSVLCATIYSDTNSEERKLLHTDVCFSSNTDPRIVTFSKKQRLGEQPTESDKTDLVYAYFERCDSKYRSRYEEEKVTVEMLVVTFPGECHNAKAVKSKENDIVKYKHFRQYFQIVAYVLASLGLLGNLISLIVCCTPSFIADQHISIYVIARCIYDTFMLIYCIVRMADKGDDLSVLNVTHVDGQEFGIVAYLQCISVFIFFMTSKLGTVLLTLVISIERYIAVQIPFKAKLYLNHRIAKFILIGVVCMTIVIPLIIFIPLYFTSGFGSACIGFSTNPSERQTLYFTLLWTGLVIVIPWLCVLVFTSLTLWKLKQASLARSQMTSSATIVSQNDPLKKTRLMALIMSVTFLVALIPEIILNCLEIMSVYGLMTIYKEQQLSDIIYICLALKSSLNFVLYVHSEKQITVWAYLKTL